MTVDAVISSVDSVDSVVDEAQIVEGGVDS